MKVNKRASSILDDEVYLQKGVDSKGEVNKGYRLMMNGQELGYIADLLDSNEHYDQKVFKKRIEKIKRIDGVDSQNIKVHNHLENNYHLGNKKALFHNLNNFMKMQNRDIFEFIPVTFHVNGKKDQEYQQFMEMYRGLEIDKKTENVWIIKPGENSNRGKGIQVCQSIREIEAYMENKNKHKNGEKKSFII